MIPRAKHIFLCLLFLPVWAASYAQCPGGYTQTQVNWDHLDVLVNAAPYTGYVTDAQEQTQRFGMGNNMMTMSMSSSALLTTTENATHTGEYSGYTGADVQFNPSANGLTITLTFATPVLNVDFALYDLDASGVYTLAASDPSNLPLAVTITESSAILSVVGQVITATAGTSALSSNDGTALISVAGSDANPVKTITITVTNRGTDVVFYLSDINLCVNTGFSTNWHQGFNNQPFTGNVQTQPDYFIVTPDNNSAYMMDPATGRCWYLFTDATRTYMNSFAYDPQNKILYYITENASLNSSNKQLKKYDFNTEASSVVINDIETTLGIPPFNAGIESAAASFYDGYLYLGIEGGISSGVTRESMVWKVDLATNTACQVYSTNAYDGSGNIIHDWADFIVKDGTLINYNSARVGSNYGNSSYTHFNMMSSSSVTYMNPSPTRKFSGQAGMSWNGNTYMIYDSVWLYSDGVISNKQAISVISVPGDPAPPAWVANAGDGSDPFRPKSDFGDAPASYDPNPLAPAVHERSEAIRLGTAWNREWSKLGVTANNDVDEALAYTPFLSSGPAEYVVGATVYNNSGSTATLIAWLDYNGNGTFDAAEAITPITVPSMASNQNFWLYWPNASNSFTNGSVTYLRLRITSGAMTVNDATGYFSNGEVEDYGVNVDDYPLGNARLTFTASLIHERHAKLSWDIEEDGKIAGYEIEKSKDGRNWHGIYLTGTDGNVGSRSYQYIDQNIDYGYSQYRVRLIGTGKYSDIQAVRRINLDEVVTIRPNPASDKVVLRVESQVRSMVAITLCSLTGREVHRQEQVVQPGVTDIGLNIPGFLPNGTYLVNLNLNGERASRKLIIQR